MVEIERVEVKTNLDAGHARYFEKEGFINSQICLKDEEIMHSPVGKDGIYIKRYHGNWARRTPRKGDCFGLNFMFIFSCILQTKLIDAVAANNTFTANILSPTLLSLV